MTEHRDQWDVEQEARDRIIKDAEQNVKDSAEFRKRADGSERPVTSEDETKPGAREMDAANGYGIDGVTSDAKLNDYGLHGRHTSEPTEKERSDGRYDSNGDLKEENPDRASDGSQNRRGKPNQGRGVKNDSAAKPEPQRANARPNSK